MVLIPSTSDKERCRRYVNFVIESFKYKINIIGLKKMEEFKF